MSTVFKLRHQVSRAVYFFFFNFVSNGLLLVMVNARVRQKTSELRGPAIEV